MLYQLSYTPNVRKKTILRAHLFCNRKAPLEQEVGPPTSTLSDRADIEGTHPTFRHRPHSQLFFYLSCGVSFSFSIPILLDIYFVDKSYP